MLRGDGGAEDRTLLFRRQPGVHHAAAPDLLQRTKSLHLTGLQHQHAIGQMLDLIQRVADVEHRNMDLLRQPLQVGQQFAFARNIQRGQRLIQQQ